MSAPEHPEQQQNEEIKDFLPEEVSPARAAYNVVSDTLVGVNIRRSDNFFQAIFIFVTVVLLAMIGVLLALFNPRWELPWFGGALIGAFAGLIIGVFASGIYLMLYRAFRHIRGKHD